MRVFPRIVLLTYGYWMAFLTNRIVWWYMRLPAGERTAQVTAFVTIVLPGVFGLAVWVFKIYSAGGRDWDQKPTPPHTAASSTTTLEVHDHAI